MTTEKLKKKIDNLMLGIHSTEVKDNNAIKEILNELVAQAENSAPIELGGESLGYRVYKITEDERESIVNAQTVTVNAYQSAGVLFRDDAFGGDPRVESYYDEISDFLDVYSEQLPQGEEYTLTLVEAIFTKITYTAYNEMDTRGCLMVFGAGNSDTGEVEWFFICCGELFQ